MKCFNCKSPKAKEVYNEYRTEDNSAYKGIQFHDVHIKCPTCGFTYNCVGANEIRESKSINTSHLPI